MKNAQFWIVDAFVGKIPDRMLRGNPAAVVLLPEFAPDAQLQERANEFNLSETAFVVPRGGFDFDLRWFTPQVEVDLCGHATLATAFALVDAGKLSAGQSARFATRSGVLEARVEDERIELDFPSQPVFPSRFIPPRLGAALGVPADAAFYSGATGDDVLVQVKPGILEQLAPDFQRLSRFNARGVIVTQLGATEDADFASRFFAPRVGINEDPVTGSAHTKLAPFWAARLGKMKLKALQLSERGGLLELEVRGVRVGIGGQCHLRARGVLC